MENYDSLVSNHYGFGCITEKISTGLRSAWKDIHSLTIDDLAPIDEFHTRARTSMLKVAKLAKVKSTDLVLDVSCELGGTARYLAEQYHCKINCFDLTEEYIYLLENG